MSYTQKLEVGQPVSAVKTGIEAALVLEITRNGLSAIADEMAINHVRAAHSSVARDMLDFSTALCDGEGRVIAQGLSLAIQLGAIPRLMRLLLKRVGTAGRGDVYLVNHPWEGGVHLPDFFFVSPIYQEGGVRPAAYAVLVSHMVDVGGRFAGSISPGAASLWEEGLVIPPVPIVQGGVLNQPLLDLIAANTRDPSSVLGDIRAALGALESGSRQYLEFARRIGPDQLPQNVEQLLNATERATRAAILRDIPDGTASAQDFLDESRVPGAPLRLACRIEKHGDRLLFDFSGSDGQAPAGINCTIADVMSVVAFVTRAVLTEDVPVNDGLYRCLEFIAPERSLINASFPAGVSSRGATVCRLADVALQAMAQLVPGRVPASAGGRAVVLLSGQKAGKAWILLDYLLPGWGGRAIGDGVPGLSHPLINAANVPVEVIEQQFPVRVSQFSLDPESGGAGMYRGAPAIEREYEMLADATQVNLELMRGTHAAAGLSGGGAGELAVCKVKRGGGSWEEGPCIGQFTLNAGDCLRLRLASSGGFGDQGKRAAQRGERAAAVI